MKFRSQNAKHKIWQSEDPRQTAATPLPQWQCTTGSNYVTKKRFREIKLFSNPHWKALSWECLTSNHVTIDVLEERVKTEFETDEGNYVTEELYREVEVISNYIETLDSDNT